LQYNPEISADDLNDLEKAREIAKRAGAKLLGHEGLGKLQVMIFEELVEHRLEQPTFITEYPLEVSPLARRNDKNPNVTDRFELFIGGREIANAYSELNDAEDQDRKSTRLNSSHVKISYAGFCLKKKKINKGSDA